MSLLPPRLSQLAAALADVRQQAAEYGIAPSALWRRALWLRRHRGFGLQLALREGLLDPRLPRHVLESTIPQHRLRELQRRVNPRGREALTEDKALFYSYCEALGLPVPKWLAVIGPVAGHDRDGQPLVGRDEWVAFIEQKLPERFIVKPAFGYYGQGVRAIDKQGAVLQQHDGRQLSAVQLVDELRTPGTFRKHVFQQRVWPHPEVAQLSGSAALQTSRMVTLVRDGGEVHVNHASLKLARARNVIDNLHGGRTGNIAARIDLATGRLAEGWRFNGRSALVRADTHPDSGRPLRGFQVPHWFEAMALVRRAALLFLPSRCLGWDIGFTADGPVIVETNMYWDPTNLTAIDLSAAPGEASIGDLLRELREIGARGPVRAGA
ncbi:MAG: hypothetical protein HS128_02115 [Ideonella sp.]|nr:hypothetical protein [Ideonella sp.]MCC7458536.1 hypothetical protein [Nitrospira sp.]